MIEARARERLERERAEYEAKLEARAEKAEKTGRKPGGRPPEPPVAGPGPKDPVNLSVTRDLRRITSEWPMRRLRTGLHRTSYEFLEADSLLMVTYAMVQSPNDKRQIEPVLQEAHRPSALPSRWPSARDHVRRY